MISEESCDTEDWSNDAENSALITVINDILKYIKIENIYFTLQNITVFTNKCSLVEQKRLLSTTLNILMTLKF